MMQSSLLRYQSNTVKTTSDEFTNKRRPALTAGLTILLWMVFKEEGILVTNRKEITKRFNKKK